MKAGKAQGAKIASRVVDPAVADEWAAKAESLQEEVDEILEEEKTEKQFAQAEMQVTKGENMMKHEAEIMSRPKRTWFETEKQKKEAKKKGAVELNGPESGLSKKEKVKLSNKDKKRMDDTRARLEGKAGWKKGKAEREAPPAPKKKSKKQSQKGKGKK